MKKQLIFGLLMIVALVFVQSVFAINTNSTPKNPYDSNLVDDQIATTTKNVWATVRVLVQIVSVACVVFAGLRYMFASADQKADIKQGLIYLAIGAILVFSTTTIIQFVVDATNDIL